MSKKGKILSIATVLLLVLSLVAVIPAGLAGAQTAGAVKFIDDDGNNIEFYSTQTGNNVATIVVEDADEDDERIATVRVSGTLTRTFDLKNTNAIFEGERDVRTEFIVTDNNAGTPDDPDDDVTIVAGTAAAAGKCTVANPSICTLPVEPEEHRLGDANADGELNHKDVRFVRTTSRTRTVDVIRTGSDGPSSPIRTVTRGNYTVASNVSGALPTISVEFVSGPGPAHGDKITLSYETYDYDRRSPRNTPIDLSGASLKTGEGTFADAINSPGVAGANSVTGVITSGNIPSSDDRAVLAFRYDQTDTIQNVQVRSDTSGSGGGVNIDLDETSAGSGVFTNTVGLVTADELEVIDEAAEDTENAEGKTGSINEVIVQVRFGGDGQDPEDDADPNDNVDLADRLGDMLPRDRLDLAGTDNGDRLIARLLAVSDGDTITASYSDRSPSTTRRGTATVDLSPPTINVIEPANNLRTRDNTPRFHVELTDTGAGIAESGDVSLTIDGRQETTVPVAIDDGFRIEFIPTRSLPDGDLEWHVSATDAVGNNVTQVTGGEDKPFALNIDILSISDFSASAGFGINDAGTARTRSDNTGIQLDFTEPLDGESIAAEDFEVSGVSPRAAFHSAELENAVTKTVSDDVVRMFEIGEFEAVDTDGDEKYDDEYTVRDADGNSLPVDSKGTTSTAVVLTDQADIEAGDEITITYTFDASQMVFLTVAALDDDATPRVEIVDEISDVAGNLTDEGDDVSSEAEDKINPVITVTLDSDLVGDPDGNGTAEGTITITSSESLASAPTISFADDGEDADNNSAIAAFRLDAGTDLEEVTDDMVWTLEYATDNSVEDMVITATGIDTSENTGASEGVELTTDVAPPGSATFTPAKEADSDDAAEGVNQGLDNVVRITADWGEEDTVVLTSTLSGGSLDGTVDVSANTFGEDSYQILGIVLDAGEYTWSIQVEDEVGNDSEEQSINFEVVAPTSFEIDLEPGWNLISIPTRLDAALPGSVFGDENPTVTRIRTWSQADGWRAASYVVVADDPATADVDESSDTGWAGDILALSPGTGYYVFSETGENVETALRRIPGLVTPPPPQPLGAGWNLIGPQFFNLPITSTTGVDADAYLIDVDWSVAYGFDADPSVGFDRIAPDKDNTSGDALNAGSGYWVYLTADGEIVH